MYIYLQDNIVCELIPEVNPAFPSIPIAERYTPEFLASCIRCDNVDGVRTGMIYDAETQRFVEPMEEDNGQGASPERTTS